MTPSEKVALFDAIVLLNNAGFILSRNGKSIGPQAAKAPTQAAPAPRPAKQAAPKAAPVAPAPVVEATGAEIADFLEDDIFG